MTDPLTLTASTIATLAFTEFLKSSTGEVAKQLTAATLAGMKELRQQIWVHLGANQAAIALQETIKEQGSVTQAQVEGLIPQLAQAMQFDPAFASQLSQLANSLIQEPRVSTILGQNIQVASGNSTANQINDPTAPVFTGSISGGNITINYHQPPASQPTNLSPTTSPTSNAAQRLALFQKLASLPGPQFEQVLFGLNSPPGNVPSAQASQGDRVKALLDWATSIGPGLSEVEAVYDYVINPR